jgi:hypothetical protein
MIGQGLDQASLEEMLDEALLTDDEFRSGPSSWVSMSDPFPKWS